jgi:hypothetical protein
MISKIQKGECSIKQAFFRIDKQKYLANHVIETKQAESELQCGMNCVGVGSCTSVNYKTSGIGKGLCELNSKTLQEISDPDENMHNPEFSHLYIIKKVRKIRTLFCNAWIYIERIIHVCAEIPDLFRVSNMISHES